MSVYTVSGKQETTIQLPNEIFAQKVNSSILTQAIRVYEWRKHRLRGKTKTRGEVIKTTAKWYRQKGTGRARHGSKSAPIFVGGGIAHGPRGIRKKLYLSRKIARNALFAALSSKTSQKHIYIVDVNSLEPKTRAVMDLLSNLKLDGALVLFIHGGEESLIKGARNLMDVTLIRADMINTYEVLKAKFVVITKLGFGLMMKTFGYEKITTQKKPVKTKEAS